MPQVFVVHSKNLVGLYDEAYVTFEVTEHSTEAFNEGMKYQVHAVDPVAGTFEVRGHDIGALREKRHVRWGLAKDDVTPQDIFRLTRRGPAERAVVAKYCIQDCKLPMHLFNKIDMMTGFVEMANLCSVPNRFIVLRGQGIKLTSYMAKKCMEWRTLMPTIAKANDNSAYMGAIVLEPKCDLYLTTPIACVDYGSLYPSSMISDNISHDTLVYTKYFDLDDVETAHVGKDDLPRERQLCRHRLRFVQVDHAQDGERQGGEDARGVRDLEVRASRQEGERAGNPPCHPS